MQQSLSAVSDLGLGSLLGQQTKDETEEEKRRKKLGLSALQDSSAAAQLFGFGKVGGNAG